MKKFLSVLFAAALCVGCVSNHPKSTIRAVSAQHPLTAGGTLPAVAPVTVTPLAVATALAPVKATITSAIEDKKVSAIAGITAVGISLLILIALAVSQHWLPLIKKALAWVKSKNILADLKKLVPLIVLCSFCVCGCVHLPSTSALPTGTKPTAKGPAAAGSPAHRAIQAAVNWQMTLCILGGVACLVLGGLAIYGGQLLPGVKLVIAGLLLPIFGIWWAYHWLLVTIIVLIGLAAFLLITHYAVLRPALVTIEAWAKTVEARLVPAPEAPAAPVAEAPVKLGIPTLPTVSAPTPFRKTG